MTDSEKVQAADTAIQTAVRQAGQVDTIDARVNRLCLTVHGPNGNDGVAAKVEAMSPKVQTLYNLCPDLVEMVRSQRWQTAKIRQLITGLKTLGWTIALGSAGAVGVWLVSHYLGKA